jgi:hypothetical protein
MLPAAQAAHTNWNITQGYTTSPIAKGKLLNRNNSSTASSQKHVL